MTTGYLKSPGRTPRVERPYVTSWNGNGLLSKGQTSISHGQPILFPAHTTHQPLSCALLVLPGDWRYQLGPPANATSLPCKGFRPVHPLLTPLIYITLVKFRHKILVMFRRKIQAVKFRKKKSVMIKIRHKIFPVCHVCEHQLKPWPPPHWGLRH